MTEKSMRSAYWLLPEVAAREVFLREIRRNGRGNWRSVVRAARDHFYRAGEFACAVEVLREVGPVDIDWRFIAFDSVNNYE